MGNAAGREMVDPMAVNTPMLGLCVVSGFFNSVERGRFRMGNAYTNAVLMMLFGLSTGFANVIGDPLRGAQLGVTGSLLFLAGRPLKALYTNKLFSPYVHNAIGSFYCGYHALQWYKAAFEFEDAGEDRDDDEF